MPLTDEEIREKVIRHDYEFKALSESLNSAVKELHELTKSLKSVAVINEKIENLDGNLRESVIQDQEPRQKQIVKFRLYFCKVLSWFDQRPGDHCINSVHEK